MVLVQPHGAAKCTPTLSLHEESLLVASCDEVATEEEGSGVEAVVRGEKRGWGLEFMDTVLGGLVCGNPCGVIIRVLDLGQSINRLPLQTLQSWKLDLWGCVRNAA